MMYIHVVYMQYNNLKLCTVHDVHVVYMQYNNLKLCTVHNVHVVYMQYNNLKLHVCMRHCLISELTSRTIHRKNSEQGQPNKESCIYMYMYIPKEFRCTMHRHVCYSSDHCEPHYSAVYTENTKNQL